MGALSSKERKFLLNILLLGLGGAIGAVTRYLLGLTIMKRYPHPPIPIAMLSVNLLGSLGLGLFLGFAYQDIPIASFDETLFLSIGIGFFGAFTTFSTFSMETIELVRNHHYKKATIYVLVTIAGSLIIFPVGYTLGLTLYAL